MTISEKLQILAENEEKVYHAGYISGFNSAPTNGKRFTTGTVTFTTTQTQQIVTHNLGVIPSCVMLYPKDLSVIPEQGTQEVANKAYRFVYVCNLNAGISNGFTQQGNPNTFRFVWQNANSTGNAIIDASVNETTFKTGATGVGYKFPADIEFEWVAIE